MNGYNNFIINNMLRGLTINKLTPIHGHFCLKSFSRGSTGSSGTLMKNEVPKERFMNRSEWMANKFKDKNLNTYDWIPEIMTSIDPSPTYHNKAMEKKMGPHHYKKVRASEGLEDQKHALIKQNQMEERSRTGRLLSHIKHVEMKNFIRDVKIQEGSLKKSDYMSETE